MHKQKLTAHAVVKDAPKGSSKTGEAHNRQGTAFVPTEEDARKARARMRPEVRKAYEKSLKQFGGAYKRLVDI